jgi:ribosomal protein S21
LIRINVRNGDIQGALKELKKRVKKAGILDELKEREYFIPKGEKRKMKSIAAKRKK